MASKLFVPKMIFVVSCAAVATGCIIGHDLGFIVVLIGGIGATSAIGWIGGKSNG